MTKAEFNAVFTEAVNKWRELAPKDTGHLALNAIKGQWINDKHFRIYVDRNVLENEPNIKFKNGESIKGRIAHHYYAKTINDNPKYRTYGWVEKTAMEVARYIARRLGGEIR